MGAEVLMVGVLGWPTPTEDMEFWRPVFGELSMAGEGYQKVSPQHPHDIILFYIGNNLQTVSTLIRQQVKSVHKMHM